MNIQLHNVSKRYGQSWALDGLTLSTDAASCLALIGPSGGGKSTTLRILAGLERATSGKVVVNGFDLNGSEAQLRDYRRSIGVVFQSYNLFPHYDALTNIALPLEKVYGQSPAQARSKALALLERLQLQDHRHKKPAALSGGQSQRVALARALAHEPKLLLLDEPTSALDPEMTAEVLDVVIDLIREKRQVVIATHEMGFARQAAERVALIADGKLIEEAPAQNLFDSPKTKAVQRFLGRVLKY